MRASTRSRVAVAVTAFLLLAGACRRRQSTPATGGAAADPHEDPAAALTRDVPTDHGVVRGVRHGEGFAFRGIPYATPPVGELRFAPPGNPRPWATPRDASAWGACCPQLAEGGTVVEGQEDCLTLNVWTAATGPEKRPVLVFLHGGGNIQGCSAQEGLGLRTYEGDVLASQGVVVVTLNYRLGPLGFLEHASLGKGSTNLGLRDQVAALEWVQRNIAAFGGDPRSVLLFGESAGAEDTCAHVVSPRSRGLFARALMESAMCPKDDLRTAEEQGATIAAKLGCGTGDVAGCLREKPVDAILKGAPGTTLFEKGIKYTPVIDGDVLREAPLVSIAKGTHNHVPFVVGDNSAETLLWVRDTPIRTELGYRLRLEEMLGRAVADKVVAAYPAASFADAKEAYVAATTDAVFVCPARALARALAKGQSELVYRYFFTHSLNTRSHPKESGAIHGLELLFVFGHLTPSGYRPTPSESALATTMQGYWTRFAAAGDPNGPGRPPWLPYDAARDNYLTLDDTVGAGQALHAARCDLWDSIGPH